MKSLFRFIVCLACLPLLCNCNEKQDTPVISINGGASFLSLDASARSGQLSVGATSLWEVTTQADWVSLSAAGGSAGSSKLGITLEANHGQARSAVLTFVCAGESFPFQVSQSAHNAGFDAPDYYFYITFGTMPTLYAGLHLLSHDKPSYVFYGRTRTFVPEEFPSRADVTTGEDRTADATKSETERMRTAMKRRIREINAADPTAVFGLYVDDLRCRIGYDWFVGQGIDSSRVRVSMLFDGTATYNNFRDYFGKASTAERNWNQYASQVEALDWDHQGRYPETRTLHEFESWTWPFYLSTRPGYRLVLQDKKLLESSGEFMTSRLAQMHIESVQPYQVLASLPRSEQERFYRMAAFDYTHFAGLFDASPRKNLIIIGTNPGDDAGAQVQRRYVSRIVEQYGAQYDIFFKPHPADKWSSDYEERFGLTLLPGQMPFEIFVWSLIEKIDLIGGYPSTVFLTVPLQKIGFLFAPNAASLVPPLDLLFRNADGVEWIQ